MDSSVDIVKHEFGEFVKLHPDPEDVISYLLKNTFDGPPAMVGMVQRAVKTLAEQLNASDAHFILELIQNFEDNEYGSALPTMFFHLDNDKLYVACNEVGMKAIDVYALCNVGDSTKKTLKDDAHGYLGEKGIGFKSIFKVAHTVQVYSSYASRDGMWKFDLTETPRKGIGYIVPGLLDNVPSQVSTVLERVCNGTHRASVGGTCLVLHLKQNKVELVSKQIKQLSPETIMFLRKINKVTIQKGKALVSIQAEKIPIDLPSSLKTPPPIAIRCKLRSTQSGKPSQQEEFLIFQDIYDMKPAPCKEREGMGVRSISIAIPNTGQSGDEFRGKIFAYLPTGQETMLPFHINADFLLTASRNDMLMDHKWNRLLFDHVVNHTGLAARYLASLSQTITFVDVLQLVPILTPSNSFSFLHKSIVDTLKPVPLFPIFQQQDRKKGDECVIAPLELMQLLKPNKPLPSQPFIADLKKIEAFSAQAQVIGVKQAGKNFMELVIQSILPISDEPPDPAWFCNLYIFMSSHHYWKIGQTYPATKLPIILLSDNRLVSFSATAYHQYAKEIHPLRKWWNKAPMLAAATLPKQNEQLQQVRMWLEANRVHKLDARSASHFIALELMEPSCSSEDILAATTAIFANELSSFFSSSSLPMIDSKENVIRPPFKLPIVTPDNHYLRLFNDSDLEHFYILNKAYLHPRYKSKAAYIFPISSAPPLPEIFSWMVQLQPQQQPQQQTRVNINATLLLDLMARSLVVPSQKILHFLDSNEWLPTSKGKTTPRKAFMPSPELTEVFSDSVPFVTQEIYQNELLRNSLLKYTKVNRTATTADVLGLLSFYKENHIKDLTSVLPLLKYLLEKKAKPPLPYSKSHEGAWEWKNVEDCIWVKEYLAEVPTNRTNLGESILDLSILKKLLPKAVKRYSAVECVNAYKQFVSAKNPQVEVVEKVLFMFYKRFPKELSQVSNLLVWCGYFHQFQPAVEVLFNDQNSLAKRFAINQLKLLWFPKEIETKSQKVEIATLLKVNSISTEMIDLVESKRLQSDGPVPVAPLFSRFVRYTLCRWHFNRCKPEWDRGVPERIHELLQTHLQERCVVELAAIKGVKVNGEVIKSSVKSTYKSYLDHKVDPAILYRTILDEEQVVEEFVDYLAKVLRIAETQKDNFELIMTKAILRHQQTQAITFLEKIPNIPRICKDPASTAYLPPLSESEKVRMVQAQKDAAKVVTKKSMTIRLMELTKEMGEENISADKMGALIKKLQVLTLEKQVQEASEGNKLVRESSDPFKQPMVQPRGSSRTTSTTSTTSTITTSTTSTTSTITTTTTTTTKSTQNEPTYSATNYTTFFTLGQTNSKKTNKAKKQNTASLFGEIQDSQEQTNWLQRPPRAHSASQETQPYYSHQNRPSPSFNLTRIFPLFSSPSVPFQKRSSAPKNLNFVPKTEANNFNNTLQRDGTLPGVVRIVVDRPNQFDVRAAAIERYGGCIITGTSISELVQAAHIKPWSSGEPDVDDDDNIILLRSDIHLMLDSNPAYLYFSPSQTSGFIRVNFTGEAQSDPNYEPYHETEIRLPEKTIELLLEYGPDPPVDC